MEITINMSSHDVKEEVEKYSNENYFGSCVADCFTPWWLQLHFKINHDLAKKQSSDGSNDFGIDGFYYDNNNDRLYIIQSKFTRDESLIKNAIVTFKKITLDKLEKLLDNKTREIQNENRVINNLRDCLYDIRDKINKIHIVFVVIHLNDEMDMNRINDHLQKDIDELISEFKEKFSNMAPPEVGILEYKIDNNSIYELRAVGKLYDNFIQNNKMFLGIINLSDIIDIYRKCGDEIFEKNVRYFINSRKNISEEGPVGNIEETIKEICEDELDPHYFTLYHNGITMCCNHLEYNEGKINMTSPYIVNGCQTIKGISLFFNKTKKLNKENFDKIYLPIRIIQSRNDELIYDIAKNNNRQNSIRSSGLRANDSIQRRLKNNFEKYGIFYERQYEEYININNSQDERDKEKIKKYKEKTEIPIYIEDLAQAIASITDDITYVNNVSKIFESNSIYKRVFDEEKHLKSIPFLIGLYNVYNHIGFALKDIKNFEKYSDIKEKHIKWHILYLLMRYIWKNERNDFLQRYCIQTYKKYEEIIDDIEKKIRVRSDIMKVIVDIYLKSDEEQRELVKKKELLNRAANKLYLGGIDPFEGWPEEVPEK